MTKLELETLGRAFGRMCGNLVPPPAQFILVIAAPAEPGEVSRTHTTTASNMSADNIAIVLSEVLHAVEAHAEEIVPGCEVDATPPPKGAAS